MSWCLHEGTDAKDSQGTRRRRRKDRGAHPEEDPRAEEEEGQRARERDETRKQGPPQPRTATGERKEGGIRRKVMIMLFLLLF